ncbi:TetR/AcrR family transcriptional regulator [Anaerobacillus sp. HL2]|nr:TetR/AcrR family transcriptional regulator [Anaerobacillus sp. HL2]
MLIIILTKQALTVLLIKAISRGSFYQYFDDLEDLFRYIFKLVADEKQLYMNQKIGSNFSNDLFFKSSNDVFIWIKICQRSSKASKNG